MPMYDFRCGHCGHLFEEITPHDAPPPACPSCGAPSERQLSMPKTVEKRMSPKGAKYAEAHKRRGSKPFQ